MKIQLAISLSDISMYLYWICIGLYCWMIFKERKNRKKEREFIAQIQRDTQRRMEEFIKAEKEFQRKLKVKTLQVEYYKKKCKHEIVNESL